MTRNLSKLFLLVAFCLPLNSYGSIHHYRLFDHPDGNQNPPPYGLRLDNVFYAEGFGGVTTFSFNSGVVYGEIDDTANTLRINGDIYGGVDDGLGYSVEVKVGLDFTYSGIDMTGFDPYSPMIEVPNGVGYGSITVLEEIGFEPGDVNALLGHSYGFADQPNHQGVAFNFKDTLHRGYDGINGWGWVDLDSGYGGTHDFLFTAQHVPEPASLATWSFLGIVVCSRWRRRKRGTTLPKN